MMLGRIDQRLRKRKQHVRIGVLFLFHSHDLEVLAIGQESDRWGDELGTFLFSVLSFLPRL
jgi:hypothetical protein